MKMEISENEKKRIYLFEKFLKHLDSCLRDILETINAPGAESGLTQSKGTAITTIDSLIMLSRDTDQRRILTLLRVAIKDGDKNEVKSAISNFSRDYDAYFKNKKI